jgi:spore coat protein U-like protein
MKKTLLLLLLAPTLAFAPPAPAGTASGTLTVKASVTANCTVTSATLDFGNYDPLVTYATSPDDADTTMSVSCTKGSTPVQITIPTLRTMTGTPSGDTLPYQLYSDSARTSPFVATVPGYLLGPFTSKNTPQVLHIYGRIAAGLDVSVSSYLGTILVTANF